LNSTENPPKKYHWGPFLGMPCSPCWLFMKIECIDHHYSLLLCEFFIIIFLCMLFFAVVFLFLNSSTQLDEINY
jgi:hypothetical protein